jgi:hypothetical protein
MDESSIKNFIATALRSIRMAFQTKLNPTYIGGDYATDDTLSGTAGAEKNYAVMPVAFRPAVAGDPVIMLPFGNGKVLVGTMYSMHLGKPLHDSYWFVPVESPTVETPLAVASRARRFTAPKTMPVTIATVNVTTAQASSTATVKIYADDGTTTPVLLWTSNGIATTANGIKKSSATSPFWVYMGFDYIIEYSNDNAAVAVSAHSLSATADNILNDGAAQIAINATNIVGNTPSNTVDFPIIKLT